MPPACNRRLFKGRLGVVLRATRGVRNNIPYKYDLRDIRYRRRTR